MGMLGMWCSEGLVGMEGWGPLPLQTDTTRSIVVIRVKDFQVDKTIKIQLVRPTEVCGKV